MKPAAKKATSSKRGQPARRRVGLLSQRLARTRGGVIARVWRSRRQKLNRPFRSMWVLTSKAAPYYYHESVGSLEPGRPAYGDAAGMIGLSRALAVLATKWFQGSISAKGRVVVMIRQSDIRTALVSLAGSTEVFQPLPPPRRLMQPRPLTQTATLGWPKTFILCRLSGKVPAPRVGAVFHAGKGDRG